MLLAMEIFIFGNGLGARLSCNNQILEGFPYDRIVETVDGATPLFLMFLKHVTSLIRVILYLCKISDDVTNSTGAMEIPLWNGITNKKKLKTESCVS
jgi:hypothetical protein